MKTRTPLSLYVAAGVLMVTLPGCWDDLKHKVQSKKSEKKAEHSSSSSHNAKNVKSEDVLLHIAGKPAVTKQDFYDYLDEVKKNPNFSAMMQMQPNAEYELVFKALKSTALCQAWGEKNNIHESEAFKKERARLHDIIDKQLYAKYYEKEHPVKVTDKDVHEYYNEHKDSLPNVRIAEPGVDVEFAKCDSKEAAQKLLEKAKEHKDLRKAAKEAGVSVAQTVMNKHSKQHKEMKAFALGVKEFPQLSVVKSDNTYFVVKAVAKKEAEYKPFKEVKEFLKPIVEQNMRGKKLTEALDALEKELDVVENSDFFKKFKKDKDAQMKKLQELLKQHQSKEADKKKEKPKKDVKKQSTKKVEQPKNTKSAKSNKK